MNRNRDGAAYTEDDADCDVDWWVLVTGYSGEGEKLTPPN